MTFTPDHARQHSALREILAERSRQDAMWGEANIINRSPELGLIVLMEEVGEVAEQILEWRAAIDDAECAGTHAAHCRAELVQVAAVALAMLEAFDNGTAPPAGRTA